MLYADVRAIVSDDEALQDGLIPALEQYNMEQFITVPVPGQSHQVCERYCVSKAPYFKILRAAWKVIISRAGKLSGEGQRYIDPRSRTSFELDHIRLVSSCISAKIVIT